MPQNIQKFFKDHHNGMMVTAGLVSFGVAMLSQHAFDSDELGSAFAILGCGTFFFGMMGYALDVTEDDQQKLSGSTL